MFLISQISTVFSTWNIFNNVNTVPNNSNNPYFVYLKQKPRMSPRPNHPDTQKKSQWKKFSPQLGRYNIQNNLLNDDNYKMLLYS